MKDVDAELFRNPPRPSRIRIGRDTLVHDRGGAKYERPIDDVGMAGDPADIGHAPVDVFRVDVLDVFRGAGDISQITARAVLASLRLTRRSAGVHEEERRVGRHRLRLDPSAATTLEQIVDDVIATLNDRLRARIFSWMTLPDQHLLDPVALLRRILRSDVGLFILFLQATVAIVGVHRDEDTTAGIDDPVGASLAAEAAEDL